MFFLHSLPELNILWFLSMLLRRERERGRGERKRGREGGTERKGEEDGWMLEGRGKKRKKEGTVDESSQCSSLTLV